MAWQSTTGAHIQIDVGKSIKKGRLVPVNLTADEKFNVGVAMFFSVCFIVLFFVLPIVFFAKAVQEGNPDSGAVTLLVFFCTPGVLVLHSVFSNNRLRTTTGSDPETNKALMLELLKRQFPRMELFVVDNVISGYRGAGWLRFSVRLFVLFDDNRIYMTVSRLNYLGIRSMFHSLYIDRVVGSAFHEFKRSLR